MNKPKSISKLEIKLVTLFNGVVDGYLSGTDIDVQLIRDITAFTMAKKGHNLKVKELKYKIKELKKEKREDTHHTLDFIPTTYDN